MSAFSPQSHKEHRDSKKEIALLSKLKYQPEEAIKEKNLSVSTFANLFSLMASSGWYLRSKKAIFCLPNLCDLCASVVKCHLNVA